MYLWDTHMHCNYSGDSEAEPMDMIHTAMDKGLSGIIFTDHLDLDYREEPGLFDLDLPLYTEEMNMIAAGINNYSGFHVGVGLELGLQPHLTQRHHKILEEYSFDQVIGSTHVVEGVDPYYDRFYEGRNAQEAYSLYFQEVLANIKAFDDFDTLGHLDYVSRYGMRHYGREQGVCRYEDHAPLLDEILTWLISHDKALEVNTGNFRGDESATDPNPSYPILQRYYELGGRRITLGADAHTPEHIGLCFTSVVDRLKAIGFDEITYYLKRTPYTYKI